jgi:pimeloyl-ACP methyl ester carboxylesterase
MYGLARKPSRRRAAFAIVTAPALFALAAGRAPAFAQQEFLRFDGAPCPTPSVYDSPPGGEYDRAVIVNQGNVVELATRRTYFLDYPCDLRPGEQVTLVLSLHGGGSFGNWQRHYFPLKDYVAEYRLVVATPNAPTRAWSAADDAYLQNIVDTLVARIGPRNVRAFWLVGHSQGGLTSQRLVCTEYFRDKVDGFLSLSGGRLGGNPGRGSFGLAQAAAPAGGGRGGAPPAGTGRGGGAAPAAGGAAGGGLSCEFSHVFTTGEHEMDERGLPERSAWAERFACGPRVGPREVVDTQPGYVYDSSRLRNMSRGWGLLPAPGVARVYEYRGCRDGRVVADVVRVDKGHTEGLEPNVTEELVRLMVSASGGKIQRAAR